MYVLLLLLRNIFRYDGLIFIAGIVNIVLYFRTKNLNKKINVTLHPKKNMPLITMLKLHLKGVSDNVGKDQEIDIYKLDNLFEDESKVNRYYSMFISLTSIFPLMGIAGTVLALLSIQDFTSELISDNFLSALTSTFWGVIWGGTFKVLEGVIEPLITRNNKELTLIKNILQKQKEGESFE